MTKQQCALHSISSPEAAQTTTTNASSSTRDVRLYRLPQVLARIPVSRSSWFAGIKAGRYPKGYSLGLRTTVWRSDEIDQLISSIANASSGSQVDARSRSTSTTSHSNFVPPLAGLCGSMRVLQRRSLILQKLDTK